MSTDVQGPSTLRQKIKILRVTRQLVKSGVIQAGMTNEDIADAILMAMLDDDPAMIDEAGFDWQALLDLIIKLLPLLLALFGL